MRKKITPYIYILLFLFSYQYFYSQNLTLTITSEESNNIEILNGINFQESHKNEKSLYNELDSITKKLHLIGFINSHIDSIIKKDSIFNAKFNLGKNFETIKISFDKNSIDQNYLKKIIPNLTEDSFTIKIYDVPKTLNAILNEFEKSGNSFTEIFLDNILKNKNEITAQLKIKNTASRNIDKIIVNGYNNFSKPYLKYYLNLKTGTVFNKSKLIIASEAIQSLTFINEIKPPEVLFTNDSTTIYLYINKVKSNKFDGLIGFSSDSESKLKFNGYLDLLLNNAFNKGEILSLNWKSNGQDRKHFNLEIETPYIFNTRITPKGTFNIFKQDSTFLNIKAEIDLSYILSPKSRITAKYLTEKSNDLNNENTNDNINEYRNHFFGLSFTYKKSDKLKPYQNKFYFSFNSLFGNRNLTNENTQEKQQKYELITSYLWSLNQKNDIFIQSTSQLLNSNNYYTNELFRIGGANSIRGFNEESIFSSSNSILNIEYRYNLAQLSYLYSITDFAILQNNIIKENNKLFGFGIGYVYNTKAGLIDISYAIGKTSDIPFNFDNSRFHIKLIQFF
ncbi:BamA/TamA family outer membrane protein [Urechidicola croceus]|uniref:hypothetical protein n=1 Tax=Urechidicola croceus TaxID=1850246 RepID=UPI0012EA7D80|nr:hypothetical protein [Urechidicola croceus]